MNELFELIESRIRASGYLESVSGEEIYEEICDEIEDKEEGSYIFMSKKEEGTFFEYKIDVLDDQFNLGYMVIHTPEKKYRIQFDD